MVHLVRRYVLISLVLGATFGASSASAAVDSLVLTSAGLRGWHAVPLSPGTARADLKLGAATARGHLQVQADAARHAGLRLRSEAFVFDRSAPAVRAISAWSHVVHARRTTLGQDGRVAFTRTRRGSEAFVVWREGARVGLLKLSADRRHHAVRSQALDYARLADTLLRTQLPSSRWGRVLEGIRPDGSVTTQTALQSFAVAYGSLPGVSAPAGRHAVVQDGTGVMAWMSQHARSLTQRQRQTVDARLGLNLSGVAHVASDDPYGDPSFREDRTLTRLIYEFIPKYEALTHHHLGLPVLVGHSDAQIQTQTRGEAAADAFPVDSPSGTRVCRVRLLPAGRGSPTGTLLYILAHEAWHCFQFDLAPDQWRHDASWIIEGGAEWAAATVDPVPDALQFITDYIATPHRPLFERDYDAAGFWGHAADMSTPETIFLDMAKILNAGSNVNAYGDAGGFATPFLNGWGTSIFRQTTLTPEWQMHSPITPPDFSALAPGDLGTISGHGDVSAVSYGTAQYVVQTHADIVHVAINGHAEIYSHGLEYSDLGDAYFCTREECTCPPGSEGTLPPLRPLFDQDYLGVTGDPGKGTTGSIESMSLSDFCHPKPKPKPGTGGGAGGSGGLSHGGLGCDTPCGSSDGDPHLETIDGYDYDFQAAGEFTAVKSTTDDLEIQERQEPFRSPDLTVNTAVAMRVAGDRVEIDAGAPISVLINGARTTVTVTPVPLPHGGTVAMQSGELVVTWPDGSQAQLWAVGPWGISYLFEPAPARAGHLRGLLGSADGDVRHLTGRDGHVYAAAALEGAKGFATKYRRFGESWRISAATSLFTYAPGRNTASYTDRSIPRKLDTLGSLSASARTAAAATCRRSGVTRAATLRDCVLDVGATGEPAFATSGAVLQKTAGSHHQLTPPPVHQPSPGTRATKLVTTCDSSVAPDAAGQIPVGTDVGIDFELETADGEDFQTAGQILIHWPQDDVLDVGETSTGDFHELDDPGLHTAYVTFAGDGDHDATQSVTCTWNVAG